MARGLSVALAAVLVVGGACGGATRPVASLPPAALQAHHRAQEAASPVAAAERDPLPVRERVVPTTRASRSSGAGGRATAPGRAAVRQPTIGPAAAGGTALASWYGRGCCTASGERFDPNALTFAARSRQWGRRIRFCHEGRCVVARKNDYGPAAWTGRMFDLSRAAFAAIASPGKGEITVTWEVV